MPCATYSGSFDALLACRVHARQTAPLTDDLTRAMPNDTITLGLHGEVTLDAFASAVSGLSKLVSGLSEETHGAGGVRWEIEDLEVGSATATVKGVSPAANGAVEQVVAAYLEVGEALAGGTTIPFSTKVRKPAEGLAQLVRDGVEAVRFETAEADALIRSVPPKSQPPAELAAAYGAVTGRVQTLTSRSRLRFTLFDTVNDRPVSCYLAEGAEGQARDIWDRTARVEGWVSRDPARGRPVSVRRITAVEVLREPDPAGYQRARAVRPRPASILRAEDRIRLLRAARAS